VSCIIPAFNAAKYVEASVESMRGQTYSNLEIIVVDDGSTDETARRVLAIAEQDSRVRLVQQANQGVAAARNTGIEQSRGEFLAPLDADDIWYPEAVEQMLQPFLQHPDVGLVYAWYVNLKDNGLPNGYFSAATVQGDVLPTLICDNIIGTASAMLIRRKCLDQVGMYTTRFRDQQAQGCEDWDLSIRIAERYRFSVVPRFLVGYRSTDSSMSADPVSMLQSHDLMLEEVKRRGSSMPRFVENLSRSTFRVYFAQKAYRCGKAEFSRRLLREAMRISPASTLIRPSVWRLLMQLNFGRRWPRLLTNTDGCCTSDADYAAREQDANPKLDRQPRWSYSGPDELRRRRRWAIRRNTLFHQLVHLLIRTVAVRDRKSSCPTP
jgi:glycosyltransferase involved in cell wall biosynthesis